MGRSKRLHSVQDLSGGTTIYNCNYDTDSNLLTQAYPNGTTMTVTSNAADQLATITDTATSAPSTPFMSFTYNRCPAGQVSQTVSAGVPGAGTAGLGPPCQPGGAKISCQVGEKRLSQPHRHDLGHPGDELELG